MTVANIRLSPKIGVTPGERRLPQFVSADVSLFGDFSSAAESDQLDKTVNYSRVVEAVEAVASARPYNLIEALAYQIGRMVLEVFPVATQVTVRVRKIPKSLAEKADYVEVETHLP
jgi:7,8-dihydroneopterin aldolase/epimerase/oxygenase